MKLFCECVAAGKVFHFPTNSKCKHIPRSDLKTRRSIGVLQDNRNINNRSSTGFMLSRFPGGDNETAISIHRKMLPIQRNRGVCHSFAQPSSSSGIIKLTKELSYFNFLRCDFHVLLLVHGEKHKSWLGFHCDRTTVAILLHFRLLAISYYSSCSFQQMLPLNRTALMLSSSFIFCLFS